MERKSTNTFKNFFKFVTCNNFRHLINYSTLHSSFIWRCCGTRIRVEMSNGRSRRGGGRRPPPRYSRLQGSVTALVLNPIVRAPNPSRLHISSYTPPTKNWVVISTTYYCCYYYYYYNSLLSHLLLLLCVICQLFFGVFFEKIKFFTHHASPASSTSVQHTNPPKSSTPPSTTTTTTTPTSTKTTSKIGLSFAKLPYFSSRALPIKPQS
ncbi:uncharacterized protein LOC108738989 isoform X3 [Agrilus planipennis]|uniref:Uncharacterized protein LOC108738989 isoform X3 n=1 Tax=Agrilus planipennis TaxID=224129 RepID=A0A1W4WW88_AGRPL|nr:uncharacterized protein LOC108738989 isoform X3 [Agrilus planipennis]